MRLVELQIKIAPIAEMKFKHNNYSKLKSKLRKYCSVLTTELAKHIYALIINLFCGSFKDLFIRREEMRDSSKMAGISIQQLIICSELNSRFIFRTYTNRIEKL